MTSQSREAGRAIVSGPAHLLAGFGRWRTRPGSMASGLLPALIVLAVLGAGIVALVMGVDSLAAWATPFLDDAAGWMRTSVRALLGIALVVGAGVLAALVFVPLTLLVGDPFYERIWRGAELDLHGVVPAGEVGWRTSVADTVRLLLRGARGAVLLVLVGLIPLVGQFLALVGGFVLAGWVLSNELLARPLEARGMDERARRALVARHRWSVLSFGLAVQACFVVPGGAVVAMPSAVVGATRLAADMLARPEATTDAGEIPRA